MDAEIVGTLVQFGSAGLMGWMWLTERSGAAEREKQIGEAHETLMREREKLDVLVRALEGNTRAITALEVGQRRLAEVMEGRGGERVGDKASGMGAAVKSALA